MFIMLMNVILSHYQTANWFGRQVHVKWYHHRHAMTQWSATWQNKYDFGYYNDSSYNMTITIACMCEACSALAVKYVSVAQFSY